MLDENVKILQNIMTANVLNQVQIAKELNTCKQFISQILNGKRNISKNMLLKLQTKYPEFFVKQSQDVTSNGLKELRVDCGYTREQFAEILDVSASLIYKMENNERAITPEIQERIKLFTENKSYGSMNLKPIRRLDALEIKYCTDISLPANNNLVSNSSEVVIIDKKLLTCNSLVINHNKCKIITLSNDSLAPLFDKGDKCIIDESHKHFIDQQVFAFVINGQCYLRQINILPSRIKCTSISDNRDTFYLNDEKECSILGLVLKIRF